MSKTLSKPLKLLPSSIIFLKNQENGSHRIVFC